MGKNKRKLQSKFGAASSKPAKVQKLANGSNHKEPAGLKFIYSKITSTSSEEILTSVHGLSSLAGDKADDAVSIVRFSNGGEERQGLLVRILCSLLQHEQSCIALNAVGALRNLSACGNEQVVSELLENCILEPLCTLLTSTSQNEDFYSILENGFYLLCNLSEISEEAASVAYAEGVLNCLTKFGKSQNGWPMELSLAANTALLCLTENTPNIISTVTEHKDEFLSSANNLTSKIVTAPFNEESAIALHNALLIYGILLNIGFSDDVNYLQHAYKAIQFCVSHPYSELLKEYVTKVPVKSPVKVSPKKPDVKAHVNEIEDLSPINLHSDEAAKEKEMQVEEEDEIEIEEHDLFAPPPDNGCLSKSNWNVVRHWLESQQLALEIITNMAFDDSDSEGEGETGKSRSVVYQFDEKATEEKEEKMEEAEQWEDADESQLKADNLQPLLLEHKIFDSTLALLEPLDKDMYSTLEGSLYSKQLKALLNGVRERCLVTLQAILDVVDVKEIGGAERLFVCWGGLRRLALDQSQHDGVDILEGAVGAMRAVAAKFSAEDTQSHFNTIIEELNLLCESNLPQSVPGVRFNVARLMGYLGCLLLPDDKGQDVLTARVMEVLAKATSILLYLAGNDERLWISAEALDVLIDLYTNDKTDKLALECNLIAQLKIITNYFSVRFKEQKKALKEYRVLLLTVKDNLPEFIKYKGPRVLNVDPNKKHPHKEDKAKISKKKR